MTPLAWFLPPSTWPWIGRALIPFLTRLTPGGARASIERIAGLIGRGPAATSPESIFVEAKCGYFEEQLQLLRAYRPGGFAPEIRVAGVEHLDAALARGRGAILWIGHFTFYSLVPKIALYRLGVSVSHLSHPRHGFSGTRFGMRVLNPVRGRMEGRYVRERVLLSSDGAVAAMWTLRRRLQDNGVVSITVREEAQRPVPVPFMNGTIRLAAGAPDLAYSSGAALLPVFPVRAPDGSFRVAIEAPIALPAGMARAGAVEAALGQYAQLLARYVRDTPGQWRGWFHQ